MGRGESGRKRSREVRVEAVRNPDRLPDGSAPCTRCSVWFVAPWILESTGSRRAKNFFRFTARQARTFRRRGVSLAEGWKDLEIVMHE